MTDRAGQQLGNYHLVRLLGRGNFADVYLGQHIHLNTQAAIKVLRGQLASHDIESFLTEGRTIASLRHPHIIQVLDLGVEGTTPFWSWSTLPVATCASVMPGERRFRSISSSPTSNK